MMQVNAKWETHNETIVQLVKNSCNLLLGNSSCFVFVLGVYGHNARVYHFDCLGVIILKAFSYTSFPHLLQDLGAHGRIGYPNKISTAVIVYQTDHTVLIAKGIIPECAYQTSFDSINITPKHTVVEIQEVLVPGAIMTTHNKKILQDFGPPPLVLPRL